MYDLIQSAYIHPTVRLEKEHTIKSSRAQLRPPYCRPPSPSCNSYTALFSSWCGRSFACSSRTEERAGSPVFPTALPAPDSTMALPFSSSSPLTSRAVFCRFFLTNQPLRIPSHMMRPKTISKTTTGMATAIARVFVETPPPPPPLLLLPLSSLVFPPVVPVVEPVVAALEADPLEVAALEPDAVEGVVFDVSS